MTGPTAPEVRDVAYGQQVSGMDLRQRIQAGKGELLLFAVTPPRQSAAPDDVQRIADVTLERLEPLGLDGLVVYDIDDESDRNPDERPFPFLPTMDPGEYVSRNLERWSLPVVVYRAVGKYPAPTLRSWLKEADPARMLSVFVGASSRDKEVATTLPQAQELRRELQPDLLLGGVTIPERHTRRGDEPERLLAKQAQGCSFFVTQVVYDLNAAKDLVSDYHYACLDQGVESAPMVFTFSVCGSMKTMRFLQWLGVEVPRWIQNELLHADDTLEASYQQAVATAAELAAYCRRLGVPFGFNVESVSIRRAEIEASVRLAARLGDELDR